MEILLRITIKLFLYTYCLWCNITYYIYYVFRAVALKTNEMNHPCLQTYFMQTRERAPAQLFMMTPEA